MMSGKLNVLVVDDSPTVRRMLVRAVNAAEDMQVIGEAANGQDAISMTKRLHPGIIMMDLVMPVLDGLAATRAIMQQHPTPIVVVSASLEQFEADIAFEAVSAGALMVLQKPVGPQDPDHQPQMAELLNTLRAMSAVHVIHHHTRANGSKSPAVEAAAPVKSVNGIVAPRIVGIASSTGGPAALCDILKPLPANFPLPIVIVQHIAPDFVSSLAGWLASVTPLRITIAEENDQPVPGCIYLAPGGVHLRMNASGRFAFSPSPETSLHIPSCDVFLESVARTYGAEAIGVILTGMGADGANGMLELYRAGAYTIAQDEASCVVFGMPREAIERGAARQVLPLSLIAHQLMYVVSEGA
ncbi:MAG: chemotaxis-specific protein-glutamate methyltransferase CheB [Anaerolineae bacterium]|nr:chemotaxis-specific protein-glutamate methyltransferase CheB [Anaerolineae bacterium]